MPFVRDAREERVEQLLQPRAVVRGKQALQPDAVRRLLLGVLHQMAQQMLVQALADFPVRIAQPVQRLAAQLLLSGDRQVAGLEQQRLRADLAHVERRQQLRGAHRPVQGHRRHPALEQRVHQKRRGAGLEPMRFKFATAQQQQHVVRVVYFLRPAPAIAVVPLAHPLPVQAGQLRAEHRVQVALRVAADRRVDRIQGDVGEVVQLREQVHLRELADAGQEREPHVRVRVLDHPVQPAQEVPVGARHLRHVHQRVQDRLVVLVHQHRHPPSRLPVQGFQQKGEAARRRQVLGDHPHAPFGGGELLHDVGFQQVGILEGAAAEAQPHHRVALRPVMLIVDVQPLEELLAPLEELLQRVEEQTLAEPPRPRQEVVRTLLEQPLDVRGLVHVVAVLLPHRGEGLDADRQPAPDHRLMLPPMVRTFHASGGRCQRVALH